MGKLIINKKDKTKTELLNELRRLKSEFAAQILENEVVIEEIPDGYRVKAEKKVLFFSFYVNADITAKEGEYEISWESNAPNNKVEEALAKVKETLSRI
jgi:hypothetical protein